MPTTIYHIGNKKINCHFNKSFLDVEKIVYPKEIIVITDETVFGLYSSVLSVYKHIVIAPGENNKNQNTVNSIVEKLIEWQIDKEAVIIGVGGGMVMDIAGFTASIYKRGLKLGLVPTTLLGMVDAAVGGKNGINVGNAKNMLGTVYQPDFILYDFNFLTSLSDKDWSNGFAEIIKHACIADKELFDDLSQSFIDTYRKDHLKAMALIKRNVDIKMKIVANDEHESNIRKLLNFGHTLGHAVEMEHDLYHGYAISIGMVAEARLSCKYNFLDESQFLKIKKILEQYHLPTHIEWSADKVIKNISLDKKRKQDQISLTLLNGIGAGFLKEIQLNELMNEINIV